MTKRPARNAPRGYQYVIRHAHQATPTRGSLTSPDTAIEIAQQGYDHGAVEAYVIRKTDGVRIWDGPSSVHVGHQEW